MSYKIGTKIEERKSGHENVSHANRGFSLIEMMGAMLVLMVGLLGLASFIAGGVALGMQSKDLSIANQFAKEAIESVFTARILGTLDFDSVQNEPKGIFRKGPQPIKQLGRNGLPNTPDDDAAPPLTYIDPGKDNIYGTADDKIITFERFSREIIITNEDSAGALRRITVKVRFTLHGINSEVALTSLMSPIN